jgi:spore maturation protein CgeB
MPRKKILLIGPFGPGQLPESLACAFERLDYQVFRFDSDRAYFEAGPGARNRLTRRIFRRLYWDRMNASTVEIIRCVRPNLVLCIKGTYLHPKTIWRVRRELGLPIANYYADNPFCGVPLNPRNTSAQRHDLLDALRGYTRVWIWERSLAGQLKANGVSSAYLPFGVDPDTYRPMEPAECAECGQQHPVVFVGNHREKRQEHIAAMRRYTVALWGNRWNRALSAFNGRHRIHQTLVHGEDCARLYSSAAVSLNVLDDLNVPGHNMRTFEIPAAGGLMLSTYTAEQAEFFPENEAALYYREPAEMDDKIDRVFNDRDWAGALRQRAMAIAANHHYTERARVIAAELGV